VEQIISKITIITLCAIQLRLFFSTQEKIRIYRKSFPKTESDLRVEESQICFSGTSSELFNTILKNLNRYLQKNAQQVSDYHLMKDIVERNCETTEEEINTQIPFPLYLGLMGTMLGILIGVGFLIFDNGLEALKEEGIPMLLRGVALAMISSVIGIIVTIWGSHALKNARKTVEHDKDSFLSWMQAELLPELSTDFSGAIAKLAVNLQEFNRMFPVNAQNLGTTLDKQLELLKEIRDIDINGIATANMAVYDKLMNCTHEIDRMGQYLHHSNDYVLHVQQLNKELGDINQRVQYMEEMGRYFKNENQEIEIRKGIIMKNVGEIDEKLEKALKQLEKSSEQNIRIFEQLIVAQNDKLQNVFIEQEQILKNKLNDMAQIVEERNKEMQHTFLPELLQELKGLSVMATHLENLTKASLLQNSKMDQLLQLMSQNSARPVAIYRKETTRKRGLFHCLNDFCHWIIYKPNRDEENEN